jgi:hypothetical protein
MKKLLIIMLALFTIVSIGYWLIGWIPEPETGIIKAVVISSYLLILGAPTIAGIIQFIKKRNNG